MSSKKSLKKPKKVSSTKKTGTFPDLTEEMNLGFFASKTMIGVDEVGRGCLAGPVVAAAAILDVDACLALGFGVTGERPADVSSDEILLSVRDSKLVPEVDREPMSDAVKKFVRGWAIGEASVAEIESINILYASHLAMERAVQALEEKISLRADYILVDGHIIPRVFFGRGRPFIKGDGRLFTIACASIIAKVHRDQLMHELDEAYPGYGLKVHKGYSTPFHKNAIVSLGVTDIHRKTFRGVRVEETLVEQESLALEFKDKMLIRDDIKFL